RDNRVRIVIQVGFRRSPDIADVPMAVDMVKDEEGRNVLELLLMRQENGRPFLLPPGTPADIVATLRQAFAAMAKDPVFLQDAANIRAEIAANSGEDVAALYAKTYATPPALVERAVAEFRKAGGAP